MPKALYLGISCFLPSYPQQVTPSTPQPITQPTGEVRQPSLEMSGDGVHDKLVDEEARPTDEEVGLTEEESGKVASLQLVVQMMQKINTGAREFDEADSTSLQYINKEVCQEGHTLNTHSHTHTHTHTRK